MRSILSEKNLVVVLFVMVLVTFSLAHEDTKKMEQIYQDMNSSTSSTASLDTPQVKQEKVITTPSEDENAIIPAAYKQ